MRHRIVFALCGIVVSTAVILPACSGGDNPTEAAARDYKVVKTGVVSGQTIIYTIITSNIGTANSFATVTLVDEVQTAPAGSAFTSATGGTCSGPITHYSCTIGFIDAGTSKTLTLVLTLPSTGGGVENCVQAPADSFPDNNRSCVGHNVPASPNATITIVKDAQPDSAQDFDFTSTGTALPQFRLDDDADPALSNHQVFTVAPGSYSFTEKAVPGWTLDAITCTSATATTNVATRTATVSVAATDNVACTFTNKAPTTGSITIIKDATPDNAQDFAFTVDNAAVPGFSLDDDADATLSNQKMLAGLPPGTYAFTETATAGWGLSALACTPSAHTTATVATRTVSIALAAGDSIVCTFTNTVATPVITAVNPASPSGSSSAQTVTFTGTDFAADATLTLRDVTAGTTLANQTITTRTGTSIGTQATFGVFAGPHTWSAEVINPGSKSSGQFMFAVAAPTPSVIGVTTNPTPAVGGAPFTITVTGTNFSPTEGSIHLTGPGCAPCTIANADLQTKSSTTFTGSTTIQPGTFGVTVVNDPPVGIAMTSNSVNLIVNAPPVLTPTITSVSPASPTGSASPQPFTINGTNFATGANVTLRNLTTSETFADQVTSSLSSSSIVINPVFGVSPVSQSWSVEVINTGGLSSGQSMFTLAAPTPIVRTVTTSPSPARTGGVTILTVTGSEFSADASRLVITGQGCEPCVISNSALTTKNSTTLVGPITFPNTGPFTLKVQNAVVTAGGASGPQSDGTLITVTTGGAGG
jgi:hypothetical protein